MVGRTARRPSREQVLGAIREHDRFCLTTHERPDGDAVGSLAAMQQVLAALGKDAVAFLPADEFPLPYEYRFIQLDGLVTEPPADLCRAHAGLPGLRQHRPHAGRRRSSARRRCILNIDHHHDNTRFGTINHVDPHASCTAEMVWDLMHGLGVAPTQAIARGAVRRPGDRHRAASCTRTPAPRAHEMAAELIDGGVDVHAIYRRLYEGDPAGQARAAGARADQRRALRRRAADGDAPDARRLPLHGRRRELLRGRRRPPALGRGHRGGRAGARPARRRRVAARKVSLRATDDRIDVSRIARARRRRRAPARGRASRPTSTSPSS